MALRDSVLVSPLGIILIINFDMGTKAYKTGGRHSAGRGSENRVRIQSREIALIQDHETH